MSAPQSVLAAIGRVSFTVACWGCEGTVGCRYDEERDRIVIGPHKKHPMSPAAEAELSETVLAEIGRRVFVADYEPSPVHEVSAS